MPDYTNLRKINENFYYITGVPITIINALGEEIHSIGYTPKTKELFPRFHVLYNLKEELKSYENKSSIGTITFSKYTTFSAIYFCPENLESGLVIFGPFSTEKHTGSLPFKPLDCIKPMIELYRSMKQYPEDVAASVKEGSSHYSLHIKRVMQFINEKYHSSLSLTDIAANMHMNKSYLCTLFKKETNQTLSQYINEVRIEKSKSLLMDTNLPVIEIALMTGFTSQTYYGTTFKNLTGFTPHQFRNQPSSCSGTCFICEKNLYKGVAGSSNEYEIEKYEENVC